MIAWIGIYLDAILFALMTVVTVIGYWIGREAGYTKGLEAGHARGYKSGRDFNATR